MRPQVFTRKHHPLMLTTYEFHRFNNKTGVLSCYLIEKSLITHAEEKGSTHMEKEEAVEKTPSHPGQVGPQCEPRAECPHWRGNRDEIFPKKLRKIIFRYVIFKLWEESLEQLLCAQRLQAQCPPCVLHNPFPVS